MTKILHIQYPVGQGGLHLGIVGSVAYIYDCGTVNKKRLPIYIDDVITQLQEYNIKKVFVFISHLHKDHCNGMKYFAKQALKQNISIIVYLPYISVLEKICLLCTPNTLGAEFILNPIKNIKSDDSEKLNLVYLTDNDNLTQLSTTNGRIMKCSEFNNEHKKLVIFDTFVYDSFNVSTINTFLLAVEKMFGKRINDITNEDILSLFSNSAQKKQLKKEYTKLAGDINYTSLCLFAGLEKSIDNVVLYSECKSCVCCDVDCKYPDFDNKLKPWLHTGDYCLKDYNTNVCKTKFYDYYKDVLKSELFFQIPHHGSSGSIDSDVLKLNANNIMFLTGELCPMGRGQPKRSSALFNMIHNKKLVSECPYSEIQIKGKII